MTTAEKPGAAPGALDILQRFHFVEPSTRVISQVKHICTLVEELAGNLDRILPDNLEKEQTFNRLEEVVMWANRSVERAGSQGY